MKPGLSVCLLGCGAIGLTVVPASGAHAQQQPGFYIGSSVGLALLATQATALDVLVGSAPAVRVTGGRTGFDGGFALTASAGYAIGNGLRFEIEGDFRTNAQSGTAPSGQSAGDETKYGLFANAVYDADLDLQWVTPYVGVGIGYQVARWNDNFVTGGVTVGAGAPLSAAVGGSAGNFAYQVIAGLAFPVDYVTGLSITAEYRFMALTGLHKYNGAGTSGAFNAQARALGDQSHSFLVGLRYSFDAEPPEDEAALNLPPAIPQQAPASHTYIIYFDIGSVTLDPHARDVVADAARASGRIAFTRVEVSGHTDRTGTTEHNIEVSKARADAVADEMIRWGIPRSVIDIHAFGEERLAVATPAGIREARNRRVEIVYR